MCNFFIYQSSCFICSLLYICILISHHFNRSATATADAIKASSGALYNISVCRTDDLSATVAFVKESGLTIAALTEKAKNLYTEADYNSPVALVLGAEDRGISSELLRLCDTQVKIPIVGQIGRAHV